ncbi:hypothetical protein [Fibrella forsythiae]|uniref:Uncharacterized protein n=1 Tax=Fibrella forsythiae TaxID=2817061 RepID=A0ABS3JSH6_9BACT|nr:hypothetical protein [Fibrella forsythiae]MBO0952956.1 hypothetical protein [Fibrella forsythiae]
MKPAPLPFGHRSGSNQQLYYDFYARYAPKLWSIILLADLPSLQAEVVLANTLIKAWQQQDTYPLTSPYMLSHLIGLAYREGLPTERAQVLLRARLTLFTRSQVQK